ncbi:MAG: peptidylprolyl isomerase FKBP-type [uncultured bacterium (gcode 4)]|uniref:Peptidyl-prolyl cis-trans isomerase n=1 Tax=uncultured bacterium (gcode 4) TaxID=1234023 RepID=K1XIY2_9BACT|nr:MAG: peptidylprolyl isomerase FKBP-type [uncultured bacterium (gcode 4)]
MKKIFSFLVIAWLSLFVIAGCTNKDSIKIWDIVSITYTATFADGQVFDQNTEQTPLMFSVGSGNVIQGLDEAVVGMNVGDTKTVTIAPEKWYGKMYDTNNLQKVSQLIFDKLSIIPENWTMQKLGDIEGIIKGTEKDESGNTLVLFDINPRQTRDTLRYKITILAKQ